MRDDISKVVWPDINDISCIAFDFDGVFTDNKVFVDQDGVESVRCDRGDGLGIDFLRKSVADLPLAECIFIISKEKNPVVLARAKKMDLKCIHGVDDKLAYLKGCSCIKGASGLKRLVYLGNDLNDLPVILNVGFSVVPEDAHEKVKRAASVILPYSGGNGFVRAFIEKLLGIDNMTPEKINENFYNS